MSRETAVIDANQPASAPADLADRLQRAEHIISALEKGIVVFRADRIINWANEPFRSWCTESPVGQTFPEALGEVQLIRPQAIPYDLLLAGQCASLRFLHNNTRHLEVTLSPVVTESGVEELIALCTDITGTIIRQQKLDALHKAGDRLAALDDAEPLSEMTTEDRVTLLKQNLRRLIHDLLQYNVIEIRLVDRKTSRLEPLLEEGMTPEAARRVLYAKAEGNGVTGYVAANGISYLCPDTTRDSLFIEGSVGARSSMTMPLIFQDEVIGTFNVESPKPNAFSPEDLQFAELFSRELARALHTLNLLSAQQSCTATQAIEAVNREIALPADHLLTLASLLLTKLGSEPEVCEELRSILTDTRRIKQCIRAVSEDFARQRDAETHPLQEQLRGLKILVVDADDRIRRSAHMILERQGCHVETAATGAEGIAMAAGGEYDAILSAVRHPDMGGTAVYRQLKALQPKSRVILIQGFEYDGGHTVVNARQEGYWLPVLYKQPFQEKQLFHALTRPVGTESAGEPRTA